MGTKAPEYVQSGMRSVLGREDVMWQAAVSECWARWGVSSWCEAPFPKQEAGQADLLSLLFGMNQNAILKDVKENIKAIATGLAIVGWLWCSMEHESEEWKQ